MTKFRKILLSKNIILLSRLILGGIFLYTGITKILDPKGFEAIINSYQLLPHQLSHFVSIALPWIEVLGGVLLLSGILVRQTAILFSFLLVIFILAIAINLFRGTFTQCGCFGSVKNSANPTMDGIVAIIRDIFFLVPCLILIFQKEQN